jgi:hypothetical protein
MNNIKSRVSNNKSSMSDRSHRKKENNNINSVNMSTNFNMNMYTTHTNKIISS